MNFPSKKNVIFNSYVLPEGKNPPGGTSHRLVIEIVDVQRSKINVKKYGHQRQAILGWRSSRSETKDRESQTWPDGMDQVNTSQLVHELPQTPNCQTLWFEFVVYSSWVFPKDCEHFLTSTLPKEKNNFRDNDNCSWAQNWSCVKTSEIAMGRKTRFSDTTWER